MMQQYKLFVILLLTLGPVPLWLPSLQNVSIKNRSSQVNTAESIHPIANEIRLEGDTSNDKKDISPGKTDLSEEEPESLDEADEKFSPIRTRKTISERWVCITSNREKLKIKYFELSESGWQWYLRDKVVILPARNCPMIPQKIITIHGPNTDKRTFRLPQGFAVKRTSSPIPAGYKMITDRVAYFNYQNPKKYPCRPYNFYHFLAQEFFPLYSILKKTRRLGVQGNDLFFTQPPGFCPGRFVPFDLSITKPFLDMLQIDNTNISIFEHNPQPNKICYKNAVFNSELLLDKVVEATDFIKKKLSVKNECPFENLVTITQRGSYRKVLNAEELKTVAIEMGYNATVVIMEKLSLAEQAQLIHCTRVLVGVKGAALTWTVALKDKSGVIEIAWPQKEWPFYFTSVKGRQAHSPLLGIRPLNMTQIAVNNCDIKPWYVEKYYESMFLVKSNFTKQDLTDIIQNEKNYGFLKNYVTSLGKLCDVKVPKAKFRNALKAIKTNKNHLIY